MIPMYAPLRTGVQVLCWHSINQSMDFLMPIVGPDALPDRKDVLCRVGCMQPWFRSTGCEDCGAANTPPQQLTLVRGLGEYRGPGVRWYVLGNPASSQPTPFFPVRLCDLHRLPLPWCGLGSAVSYSQSQLVSGANMLSALAGTANGGIVGCGVTLFIVMCAECGREFGCLPRQTAAPAA